MKLGAYAIVLALAAAPLPGHAQDPARPARPRADAAPGERAMRRGESPVRRLIEQRERLGLSGEQVARLERIQRDLDARNRPALERIRSLRESAAAGMRQRADSLRRGELRARRRPRASREHWEAVRRTRQQARPLWEQVQANHQAARRQVEEVLTPQQEERLRALRQENRGRMREVRERHRREIAELRERHRRELREHRGQRAERPGS